MVETPLPRCVEDSLVVNARPEEVFPLLENPHSMMEWVRFLRQVQWAKGSGIGARDRCQLEIAGMKVWAIAQVQVYEKNVRIGRRSMEGMEMRSDFNLVPVGSNTRVEWAVSYRPPMGPLGSLLDALAMRRAIRKGVAASLRELKRLAESRHKPIAPVGVSDLRDALVTSTPTDRGDVRDPGDLARASARTREVPRRPSGNVDTLGTTSVAPSSRLSGRSLRVVSRDGAIRRAALPVGSLADHAQEDGVRSGA